MRPEELVNSLVPPPRFDHVRFASYLPDPNEPSQAAAVAACAEFAEHIRDSVDQDAGLLRLSRGLPPALRSLFSRKPATAQSRGRYVDGGFGVGKTHLLASLWHAVPGPKAYGTFVELTHLVGVLGFAQAVTSLSGHRLVAIDEFELDDPGDTMLITRLLRELMAHGVHVAATSNTLPDKLGEGRFAADDFLREIHSLAGQFTVLRVDGPDYRHRGLPAPPAPLSNAALDESVAAHDGSTVDDFTALCAHLASVHPSRYGRLVDGVSMVHIRDVNPAPDQSVALRLVAFADRLYDRAIPVAASGAPLAAIFTEDMLRGGYRKKYLRAISRLTALSRENSAAATVEH